MYKLEGLYYLSIVIEFHISLVMGGLLVMGTCVISYSGVVSVQLEGLESRSEVHATVDVLDERGRKPVGGKMEVCVRLREPLTGTCVYVCACVRTCVCVI